MNNFDKRLIRKYNSKGLRAFIWIKNRFILRLSEIEKKVPKKGNICELGSGFGMVSIYLKMKGPERNIVGYELSKDRVEDANNAARGMGIRFFQKDITKEKPEKHFDTFLMVDFLHHIDFNNQKLILDKISKLQKKDDRILIKEIDKKKNLKFILNFFCDKLMTKNDQLFFRTEKEWKSILNSYGYEVEIKKIRSVYPHIMFIGKKRVNQFFGP